MISCNVKKGDSLWPELGDDSGDGIFSLDSNQLIKEIRAVKRKEEADMLLDDYSEPTEKEEMIMIEEEPTPGTIKVQYDDLNKRDKVAYIINQLEKYKKNDL